MHLHRGQCHAQFTGHHLVAAPLRQQLQHLRLARREVYPGQAFGDDLYLRGIYRLNDGDVTAAPLDGQALLARLHARAVAVVTADDIDVLEAAWIAPLARALAVGAIGRLEIVIDRWSVTVARHALLKFWRGSRVPAEWVAC